MALPADALMTYADFNATRSITINARPEDIYPWLQQWGYGKAGFYGYDLIEGIGSPSGLRSAERIMPELQSLRPGDQVKMTESAFFSVRSLEPNRSMVLTGGDAVIISAMTWLVYPIDASHSRLVNRFRFVQMWGSPQLLLTGLTDVGDPIAIRKIMLGIKNRVEGRAEPLSYQAIEIGSWLLSIIAFCAAVGVIFRRQLWGRAWFVALLAAGVFQFVFFAYPPPWLATLVVICLVAGEIWAAQGWGGTVRAARAQPPAKKAVRAKAAAAHG